MTIIRWNPLHELSIPQKQVGQLVGQDWQPLIGELDFNERLLALDATENDQAYTIVTELPGMCAGDIQVKIDGGYLIIEGEIPEKSIEKKSKKRILVNERCSGHFCRTILLPQPVDSTKAKATYQDGILRLTLPKTDKAKAAVVPITVCDT